MSKKHANVGMSWHHLLARSHGGNSSQNNLIELKDKTHRSIHQLFGNENLGEKVKKLVGLERTALREDVKVKLLQCLQSIGEDDVDRYKIDVFK